MKKIKEKIEDKRKSPYEDSKLLKQHEAQFGHLFPDGRNMFTTLANPRISYPRNVIAEETVYFLGSLQMRKM